MLSCLGADFKCYRRSEGGGYWWQTSVLGSLPEGNGVGPGSSKMGEFNKEKCKRRLLPGRRSVSAKTRKQEWVMCAFSITKWLPQNRVPLCLFKVKAFWRGRQDRWVASTLAESWWVSQLFLLFVCIASSPYLYSNGRERWVWWLWSSWPQ